MAEMGVVSERDDGGVSTTLYVAVNVVLDRKDLVNDEAVRTPLW